MNLQISMKKREENFLRLSRIGGGQNEKSAEFISFGETEGG